MVRECMTSIRGLLGMSLRVEGRAGLPSSFQEEPAPT